MGRIAAALVLLAACGGPSVEWAGSWVSTNTPAGSGVELTLAGSGTTVSGSGVQHREAGSNTAFTVSGTPAGVVSFDYPDGTSEAFHYSQPDANDLILSGTSRTLDFVRKQ